MRFAVFLFATIFFGCNSNIVYNGSQVIDGDGWSKNQAITFDFEIADSEARYNLFLDIKHNTDYPFENIYVRIQTQFPNETSVQDTLSIEMTTDSGYWVGKCSGDDCNLRVFLQEKIKFSESGLYKLSFEQFTREEHLVGVKQVDFSIEAAP